MPPKKRDRRKLGARTYKNYSDQTLALAVHCVQNKNMSSYEAASTYGIPRRTIERKVKKIHMNKPGPPQRLTEQEELNFVKVLIVVADFGMPLTLMELRILVHEYLLKNNKAHIFNGKPPGEWWARAFIERHRDKLTIRSVQNIKRARAEKTIKEFQNYFDNLERVVKGVPASHLLNYDETNFSDNPGSVKCIYRRGIKYPERIMNSTKGCISVMFGGTADGKVLPPYIVYKSEGLWTQWIEGGPDDARYNRTKSGWFDSSTFFDWFTKIIVPWAQKLEGTKVVIGDNLSSHINHEVIELCEKYSIKFVLLPSNSTQLTQPLDVAFFGPLKKTWRKILTSYKVENPRQASLNKCHFPPLLKKVMDDVNMSKKENLVSGFKATGIYPFNPQKVLKKLPEYNDDEVVYTVDKALLDYLKENRKPNEMKRGKNKKLKIEPGTSISKSDITKREVTENQAKKRKIVLGNKKTENEMTDKITTEGRKLETDVEIDDYIELQNNIISTKKMENGKTDQTYTINKRHLETEVKIDELTGLQSNVSVKYCVDLSDIQDSDDRNKANNQASSRTQNKKRKVTKKTLDKKEKNKMSRRIDSGSTTTEDLEISIHSDSNIVDIDLEEEDYYGKQSINTSPELINLDNGTDARNIDIIEREIFEEIERLDQEDMDLSECDMNELKNDNSISNEKQKLEKEILYKNLHENNNNLKKSELALDIGDTILTRYFTSRQWKLYVDIIPWKIQLHILSLMTTI